MTPALENRPTYVKRDLCIWKETYICGKKPVGVTCLWVSLFICTRHHSFTWKRTYICEKRPACVKWDTMYMREETYICKKRLFSGCLSSSIPTWLLHVKNDLHMWKETYTCEKRPYIYVKRDLSMRKDTYICEKRPMYVERDLVYMWKETYIREKKPVCVTVVRVSLFICTRHHSFTWKKTCICEKRPTYVKRGPIYMRKETCICKKRTMHVTFFWLSLFICPDVTPSREKWQKEIYISKMRPYIYVKRDLHMQKENYTCDTGGLFSSVLDVTPSHMCGIAHSCMWHNSFTCVTYIFEKRPYIYEKRDLHMQKENYTCDFSLVFSLHLYSTWLFPVKIDLHIWKDTYICEKRPYIYLSSSVLDVTSSHMCDIWGGYDW